LVFAISMNKVSFYDFARYFKEQGCSNALFLDGYNTPQLLDQKVRDAKLIFRVVLSSILF
jgi:uncharacterized protein YigE (DUF2233 family)